MPIDKLVGALERDKKPGVQKPGGFVRVDLPPGAL